MWTQAVPILLGFFLTTIVGGLFASVLQQRSWRNQNEVRLQEQARDQASEVCRSLSALVDKRWYRMQRLLWATVAHSKGQLSRELLDARLLDYDQVLFEWNDELNARLAIVGAYFGGDLRDFLEYTVYKTFKEAGQDLESLYRAAVDREAKALNPDHVADVGAKLGNLKSLAYKLSFTMMVRIRDCQAGRRAPEMLDEVPFIDASDRLKILTAYAY